MQFADLLQKDAGQVPSISGIKSNSDDGLGEFDPDDSGAGIRRDKEGKVPFEIVRDRRLDEILLGLVLQEKLACIAFW